MLRWYPHTPCSKLDPTNHARPRPSGLKQQIKDLKVQSGGQSIFAPARDNFVPAPDRRPVSNLQPSSAAVLFAAAQAPSQQRLTRDTPVHGD